MKMINSIFETHSLLIENEPKIIEYAAFFGSYKIIEFIQKKYHISEIVLH